MHGVVTRNATTVDKTALVFTSFDEQANVAVHDMRNVNSLVDNTALRIVKSASCDGPDGLDLKSNPIHDCVYNSVRVCMSVSSAEQWQLWLRLLKQGYLFVEDARNMLDSLNTYRRGEADVATLFDIYLGYCKSGMHMQQQLTQHTNARMCVRIGAIAVFLLTPCVLHPDDDQQCFWLMDELDCFQSDYLLRCLKDIYPLQAMTLVANLQTVDCNSICWDAVEKVGLASTVITIARNTGAKCSEELSNACKQLVCAWCLRIRDCDPDMRCLRMRSLELVSHTRIELLTANPKLMFHVSNAPNMENEGKQKRCKWSASKAPPRRYYKMRFATFHFSDDVRLANSDKLLLSSVIYFHTLMQMLLSMNAFHLHEKLLSAALLSDARFLNALILEVEALLIPVVERQYYADFANAMYKTTKDEGLKCLLAPDYTCTREYCSVLHPNMFACSGREEGLTHIVRVYGVANSRFVYHPGAMIYIVVPTTHFIFFLSRVPCFLNKRWDMCPLVFDTHEHVTVLRDVLDDMISISESPRLSQETHPAVKPRSRNLQHLLSNPLSTQKKQRHMLVTCIVCMDSRAQFSFIPCGHVSLCTECFGGYEFQTCPVCNARSIAILPVNARKSDLALSA